MSRCIISRKNTISKFSGQCEEKKLEYKCDISGEPAEYYVGDVIKLKQVLINILGNAVKFTPENGKEAVDMFEAKPEGYYDAILMDMRMPVIDGLEAAKTIRQVEREDAKKIPMIALTANAFDEDVQKSLQAGLDAHLTKPIQPEVLFETLEKLLWFS